MYSILYVDDEPGLLEIAKLFLEQDKEFSVDTDISAVKALGPIGSRSYDAIISDYLMPGMDGIAFLKAVRERYGDIPFILFTGRGREEVVIEAINNGADFYLQKGGDPRAQFAELAHKVRQAVARKRAELSRIESEKRLTDIINFLPDATFAIDKSGTVIAWNRAIEEMTGVPAADMLGKGDYEYAIPFYGKRRKILIDLIFEPDEVIKNDYAHIFHEKDILIAETNLPRPQGKVLTLMGKASPLFNRQGEVVGAIEAIRDITQREQDAERIAQKTSALSIINRIIQASSRQQTLDDYARNVLSLTIDLLHYTAGGIYFVDPDTEIAGIFCTENLVPEFIREVDNIDIHAAPYDALFIRGEPVILENMETILPHAAAVSGFHAIAGIPIVSQDTVIGALNVASREQSLVSGDDREILIAIGRELGSAITRIKAESALRDSEEKYRTLLDFAPLAVLVHRDGKIVYANPECVRLAGAKSMEELLGRDVLPFVHPDDRQRAIEHFRLLGEGATIPLTEERFIRLDGTIFTVEVAARPVIYGGLPSDIVVFRDISEWKKTQDDLRSAYEQITASEEELRRQYEELAWSEQQIRESESRLKYMLGFYEMSQQPEKDLLFYAVEGAGSVTGSPLGYLAFLNDNETELSMYAWSKTAMQECSMREKPIIYKVEKTGLWGEAARQRHPVITNDYQAPNPKKRGYPEGHPQIIRHMNVPIMDGSHIVIVAGVANRPSDYSEREVRELTLLMQGLWQVLKRRRAEDELHAANQQITASEEELRRQYEELAGSERLLRESRERLQSFMDSATDAFTIWDADLNLVDLNRTALSYLPAGTRKEDVVGMNYEEFLPGSRERGDYTRYREVIKTGIPFAGTEMVPDPQYGRRWLNIKGFKVGDGLGIVTSDITREKEAEEKLREAYERLAASEEELNQYFNASLDLFCIAGTDGNFRRLNPEWEKALGYMRAELEGHRFLDFVHPDDLPATLAAIGDLSDQKKVLNFTNRYRHKDGTYRWIEWRSFPRGDLIFAAARDITDRKRIEEALRESEEKFRSLVETTSDFIWEVDENGAYTYVSPKVRDLLGYEPEEMIGKTPFDFMPPEEAHRVAAEFWHGINARLPLRALENRNIRKDGSDVIIETSGVPRFAKDGRFLGYRGIDRDITERKSVELKIQQSRDMFRTFVDHSYDAAFINDLDGRILDVNATMLALYRVTRDEALSLKIQDFLAPGSVAGMGDDPRALWNEVIAGKDHYVSAQARRPRDNSYFDIEVYLTRIEVEGRPFILANVRDVTGRKVAEAALKESEEKYRRILENLQDAYIRADGNGIITMVSPSAARMYGYDSVEEMIGISAESLYATPGQRHEMLRKLRDTGELTDYSSEVRRKNNTAFWVSLNVQFIRDDEGRIRGTEGIVRDVSERKAMERTIQETNRKLSLLSSITRHDVANKVAVINGFAHAAQMRNPEPAVFTLLKKIEDAGSDIARQIAFTKTYQELGMHTPGWYGIGELVALQNTAGVKLSCTCKAEIYADPMVEKVIFNIIDNAIRHGGLVTEIVVRCEPEANGLVIAIEDNGTGIAADLKEKIFEAGFGKHTGFGLFLAREILAITGITIKETGIPGQGARFELTVPEGGYRGM